MGIRFVDEDLQRDYDSIPEAEKIQAMERFEAAKKRRELIRKKNEIKQKLKK